MPPAKYPTHLAITMDGNRRWAKKRFIPPIMGHMAGAKTAWRIVCSCIELNIQYLTLFAFSTENWKRTQKKQSIHLIKFIVYFLNHYLVRFNQLGIKIQVIGAKTKLDERLVIRLSKIEELTKYNTNLTVLIALDYGGKWDILNATKAILHKIMNTELNIDDINEETFSDHLVTQTIPDPDLVIRTGGDTRLSNFLLWQIAYSEIYFSSILWPDFNTEELLRACKLYSEREKNLGK